MPSLHSRITRSGDGVPYSRIAARYDLSPLSKTFGHLVTWVLPRNILSDIAGRSLRSWAWLQVQSAEARSKASVRLPMAIPVNLERCELE